MVWISGVGGFGFSVFWSVVISGEVRVFGGVGVFFRGVGVGLNFGFF